jgi:hypothetical protein
MTDTPDRAIRLVLDCADPERPAAEFGAGGK